MGDEEDIKREFYGRGVGTGIIGAPIISDMLAVGNILEWWSTPDNDLLKMATGLKDYANVTGDRKTYEIINILNTQLEELGINHYHYYLMGIQELLLNLSLVYILIKMLKTLERNQQEN